MLDRYVKHELDRRGILACIVAMGTNMGLWMMAEVSGLNALAAQFADPAFWSKSLQDTPEPELA